MTEEVQKEPQPIFKELELNPLLVDDANFYSQLGLEGVEDPQTLKAFNNYVRESAPKYEDRRTGLWKVDPKRVTDLKVPQAGIVKDGDKRYVGVSFDDRTLIVLEDKPIKVAMGRKTGFNIFEGIPIRNALVRGENGRWLDLMSIRTNQARNLLSFSDHSSNYSPARSYQFSSGNVIEFPPDVIISMPTQDQGGSLVWDPKSFIYKFTHENGHAVLSDVDATRDSYEEQVLRERGANAVALRMDRTISQLYPRDKFFDLDYHKNWIERQLKENYDLKSGIPNSAQAFSNEARAGLRKRIKASQKPDG